MLQPTIGEKTRPQLLRGSQKMPIFFYIITIRTWDCTMWNLRSPQLFEGLQKKCPHPFK